MRRHASMYVCMHFCMCMSVYACVHTRMYVFTRVCMYVYVYTLCDLHMQTWLYVCGPQRRFAMPFRLFDVFVAVKFGPDGPHEPPSALMTALVNHLRPS